MAACAKCGGTGLADRQDGEADANLHPILAQLKGVCGDCGGSGKQPAADEHAANRAAAKASLG